MKLGWSIVGGVLAVFLLVVYVKIIEHHQGKITQDAFATFGKGGDPESYQEVARKLVSRGTLNSRVVVASWYGQGDGFAWKCKANGQYMDPNGLTMAHPSLPLGTVVALERGSRMTMAMVTDRGPYVPGREIDLSPVLARYLHVGVSEVTLHVLAIPDKDQKYHKINRGCLKAANYTAPSLIGVVFFAGLHKKESRYTMTI